MKFQLAGLLLGVSVVAFAAAPLAESTFTEIIQDVNVVTASDKTVTPARKDATFKAPDLVRTGPDSRVELTAPDQTITRIGANTVFTFEPGERNLRLEQGSLLFSSPTGKGGGTIKNRGTAAAVLGTTLICTVLPDRSFKTLVLEGQGKVTLAGGRSIVLNAGEMVIVRPDGNDFGPVMIFNLQELASRLLLVAGFSRPLPSLPLLAAAIQVQTIQTAAGKGDRFTPWQVAAKGLDLNAEDAASSQKPSFLNLQNLGREAVSPSQP
ncbi:MAG: FecR family protein [Verrucomicrobiota bacterium]|nr:FecR domain-containing protein [Verrucomicrobiota bacterium]MCC6823740.1 FecR domain-containing protein [Limisphaerales bacterium]